MLDSIEIGMATIHLSVRIHIFKEFYNFFSGQCACLGINNIQQVRPCKKYACIKLYKISSLFLTSICFDIPFQGFLDNACFRNILSFRWNVCEKLMKV